MKRPTVTVTTPARRKPGPPSISTTSAPSAAVHVKLDPPIYDQLYRFATIARVSPPEVMRRALAEYLAQRGHGSVPRETKTVVPPTDLET